MSRHPLTKQSAIDAFREAIIEAPQPAAYHNGQGWRKRYSTPPEDRAFVVWDGEGITSRKAKRLPQDYVLFGCYNGVTHERIIGERLRTLDCLAFIIRQGELNPGAFHVGFFFDYDANMIVKGLAPQRLIRLRKLGYCYVYDKDRQIGYRIEYLQGKWFQVTRLRNRLTVKIQDASGFFQSSLVTALAKNLPADHPLMAQHFAEVKRMKAERHTFTLGQIDAVEHYWRVENELFHALMLNLRDMFYDERVGLRVRSWYGPGVLANYVFRTRGIAAAKQETPEPVYDAARYAYAGGRFELYRIGRHVNAYSMDINSAYPDAISRLPNLTTGSWVYVGEHPKRIYPWSVYHVRMRIMNLWQPGPFFYRDAMGSVSYPWHLEGWYWGPEVIAAAQLYPGTFEILEGWEYRYWSDKPEDMPFSFVRELYAQRKRMQQEGIGAERAIKLALNSLYGKTAQRVGWERTGGPPTWHQLEWAGWVTSYTRAKLYRVLSKIPWEHQIAVETDGIYTTMNPSELGIADSRELGEWEVTEYEEIVYLQSGIYAMKPVGKPWTSKYRGLDSDSLSVESLIEHSKLLTPGDNAWPNIVGTTTRFVGLSAALMRARDDGSHLKIHHCVWETATREVSCGTVGKRRHTQKMCAACEAGATAYEMPHTLRIHSLALGQHHPMSIRHDIPWLEGKRPDWRDTAEEMEGLYRAT